MAFDRPFQILRRGRSEIQVPFNPDSLTYCPVAARFRTCAVADAVAGLE
jgi:hypothetical protein